MIKYCFILILLIPFFSMPYATFADDDNSFVAGTVREKNTGEFVTGVTVALYTDENLSQKPLRGTITNKFGFYSIANVAPGTYFLVARGVGYETFKDKIVLAANDRLTLNINLSDKDIRTQDITVEAQREGNETVQNISVNQVSPELIKKLPSIGGEADIFRALQLLPGIQQATELSSGLYIRGGSPDQNLTLLDGVIVYNPSHLMGFLSTFNSDAIRDVRVIKGAFPAEYGGRLSSVIDLSMKEGRKDKIAGEGGISLISSRLLLEGPIDKNSSFMISGRRMYLDILSMLLPKEAREDMPTYYFYDLNAKLNYKLSDNDQIFVSGYFGRDVLSFEDKGYETNMKSELFWGNGTGNLRWMHIVSPSLFTNFSLIYTNYNIQTGFEQSQDSGKTSKSFDTYSGIEDFMLRAEAQYFPHKDHSIKAGLETIYHSFQAYSGSDFLSTGALDLGLKKENFYAMDAAVFLQDEWKITSLWTSNLGARLYYFSNGKYLSLEPRLSMSYQLFDNFALKGSAALANQFLHLITNNMISLPTDLWFPSTATIKPSRSWQGVLGFETTFNGGEYLFSVEGYYKTMDNLYEYKDSVLFSTLLLPLESQFTTGRGNSYGVEFFLNKRMGSFTGWIGYTLAWTNRTFPELNNGKTFSPRYDRRHDISVVLTYELGESWELGLNWVYGTGQAYTMPTSYFRYKPIADYDYGDYDFYWNGEKYQFTDRNGYRMPAYHRLDLNFMYKFHWFDIPFQLSMNIYNAYNRKNPFAMYPDREYDYTTGESRKVLKQITIMPFIPTFGLSFKF